MLPYCDVLQLMRYYLRQKGLIRDLTSGSGKDSKTVHEFYRPVAIEGSLLPGIGCSDPSVHKEE